MATISVEFGVYSDPRFKLLGKLTKTDYFAAIGRMASLWMYCIDRNTSSMRKVLIDAMVGKKNYADAMIESELADQIDEHTVRIRGTEGRIEWLEAARERARKAAEAAKAKKEAEKREASESELDKRVIFNKEKPETDSVPSTEATLEPTLDPSSETNLGTIYGSIPIPPLVSTTTTASTSASVSVKKEKTNTYAGNSSGESLSSPMQGEGLVRGTVQEVFEIVFSEPTLLTSSIPPEDKNLNERGDPPPREKQPRFDFQPIYREYPRKEGKSNGLKLCRSKIKTQEAYDSLLAGVKAFRKKCEREGIETQFIPYFSSFMSKESWKDYLDPETGTEFKTDPLGHIDWSKFT